MRVRLLLILNESLNKLYIIYYCILYIIYYIYVYIYPNVAKLLDIAKRA